MAREAMVWNGYLSLVFFPGLVSDSDQILQHAAFVFVSFQDTGDHQTLR
jgi:hypothetical protein